MKDQGCPFPALEGCGHSGALHPPCSPFSQQEFGEEKAPERPRCDIPELKGGLQ